MSQPGDTGATGSKETTDIQQALRLLMEDRHQHEEEIVAERRQLVEEVAAKHDRQEWETQRRLQEMQQHVESLLKVVKKTQEASGGTTSGAGSSHGEIGAKVSKLSGTTTSRPTSRCLRE